MWTAMPGSISTMPAVEFDAWVAWLRAPTKPQCHGRLARFSRPKVGSRQLTHVCAIGGGALAVGQEPSPSSLFVTGLPYGLYANVTRMNDTERLPFSTIADRLEGLRERYVRHA